MNKIFVAFIVSMIITGCSTLYIQTDYDREFNFDSLSNFTVLYSKKNDSQDFTRARIHKTIVKYFEDMGYTSTPKENADFYILFHLNIKTKKEVETTYETMMIRPRSYFRTGGKVAIYNNSPYLFPLLFRDSIVTVKTHEYEYEEGRLNIEILDLKSNAIIWQGFAKDEISKIVSSEQIQEIVEKLFSDLFGKNGKV